jgi:magnesium transporter
MEEQILSKEELYNYVLNEVRLYQNENKVVYPYDITEKLIDLMDQDVDLYHKACESLPSELLADIVSEMPSSMQEEIAAYLGPHKIAKVAENMDTDDAADLIQNLSESNDSIAETILEKIEKEDRDIIKNLISYSEDEAGSYMQAEIFSAGLNETIGSSIMRLKQLKEDDEIDNIYQAFIVDKDQKYICSIGLEEIIIMNFKKTFNDIIHDAEKEYTQISANHHEDISSVVEKVSKYNLSVIPVTDDDNKLIGRITSDDIYDIIEEQATEQLYSMAGVDEEAEDEASIFAVAKARGTWLSVNLITAFAASIVVGLFDSTIQAYVSLAVLMPIVASMGGNAGYQSLTVTVRQLVLGEVSHKDQKNMLLKEFKLSIINGFLFAFVVGSIAHFWFNIPRLGFVIAGALIINLIIAGVMGVMIPMFLDRIKIDPAVASSVLLTTATDVIGFFSFLGLAKLVL